MANEIRECEVDDSTLEEIARLIKEGFTSGLLDDEETRTHWELTINQWHE